MSDFSMRRLLVIVPGFPGGDDEWFIPGVSEVIDQLGRRAEVRVVSLFHPKRKGEYTWRGIPVASCGMSRGGMLRWLWAGWRGQAVAKQVAAEMDCEAVLSFWATEPASVGNAVASKQGCRGAVFLAGGELVRRPDIPYGDARHGFRLKKIVDSLMNADLVLVGSDVQAGMARLGGGVPAAKVRRVPLGIASDRFEGMSSIPSKSDGGLHTMVSVADLLPVKGHELLLEAMACLGNPDLRLRFIGLDGTGDGLAKAAAAAGLAEQVEFVGPLHHSRVPEALMNADLFVQTSHWESQGIALLEAMAAGVPVISSSVGIASEAMGLAKCGTLLESREPEELADAIAHALTNLERVRANAREGAQRIRDAFGADLCSERILSALFDE